LRLQDLVDIDIFVDARKVVDALLNKDCSEALAWCAENKSKLKKSKSKLEFKLRLQEFIELVRGDRMIEAIMYARKHLASWGATNMKELQQAMATLAFKSNTDCPGYKILFDAQQWNNLIQQFKQEFYKLYGMTLEPLLHIHLQAGLSALKTPYPHIENCDTLDVDMVREMQPIIGM
jgi:macrophage erythroblast attacher